MLKLIVAFVSVLHVQDPEASGGSRKGAQKAGAQPEAQGAPRGARREAPDKTCRSEAEGGGSPDAAQDRAGGAQNPHRAAQARNHPAPLGTVQQGEG